ncbi:MAG: gamma-glutamyltransferase [Cyclobacteriaceae bacterium]
MKKLTLIFTIILLISCQVNEEIREQVGAIGDEAMVVSAHPIATKAGLEILRKGGNVFDAAVTTHFMLAVAYPRAGNIGGGGFAVIRQNDGTTACLDFREVAPLRAHEKMYQDANGNVIPNKSQLGHFAVAVPGSVAGIWKLHQEYGTKDWGLLVQPAIDVAFDGFAITQDEANTLNEKQEEFISANYYQPWSVNEQGWKAGDLIIQKQLAATLSFIRDNGQAGFYSGIVADQIAKEMQRGGGLITKQDLAAYEAKWRLPVTGYYKGHKVISMSPPSSGGAALMQMLQGAEMHQLGKHPHNSTTAVHLMAEIERRVFADRAMHLGDPDFVDIPLGMLTSKDYNTTRFSNIDPSQATSSKEVFAGEFELVESMETTHFSIVDPFGNAIAITTTLNGNYGSKVMVEGAGFFLNNIMDDFSSKPGAPDMFGAITGKNNAIAPEKRMVSSMTPTIVEKDGGLKMVLGTPGGPTIITSIFQTIINVIDHEMSMQDAVSAKKIHHQWQPDRILVEEGALSTSQLDDLKAMGHNIEMRDKIGRTDCILVTDDGKLEGGADYTRGDDYAEGF